MVGYLPIPDASQGVVLGGLFTPSDVAEFLATTHHKELVFVGMDVPYDEPLKKEGWVQGQTESNGGFKVTVWRKG